MSPTTYEQEGPSGNSDQTQVEAFHLQVVSPSAGVNGPLSFPRLPVDATVKQLKEKIREALPIKPSDDLQRLIHRGRLLARETETMSDIFGHETLKASDTQTLHLVLKPSSSDNVASSISRVQTPDGLQRIPTPHRFPPDLDRAAANQQNGSTASPANRTFPEVNRIPTPPQFIPPPPLQPSIPNRPVNNDQAHHNQIHHYHSQLHQHLNRDASQQVALSLQQQLDQQQALLRQHQQQLFNTIRGQPPPVNPTFQNLIAQQQQNRAALGMQGVQQDGTNIAPQIGQLGHPQPHMNRGPYQLHQTRTTTQEISGPNGERWQITVNGTTMIPPPVRSISQPGHAAAEDLQNMVQSIVRAMDRNTLIQRSRPASPAPSFSLNPSLAANFAREINRPASAPPTGPSNPIRGFTGNASTLSEAMTSATNTTSNLPLQVGPTVYILSSPSGPRGLIVSPSDNGFEAFYTPQQQGSSTSRHLNHPDPLVVRTDRQQRREERAARHAQRHAEEARRLVPGEPPHPANPPAGAVAAQLWPRIWLVVRLLGFVWFFTSGNSNWWRTIMVSALALILFIASTGILNDLVEQVWGPFRRHLEALLPLAGPDGAHPAVPANNAAAPANPGAGAAAPGQLGDTTGANQGVVQDEPNPAQTAARLLEQRRFADENWLWTQFRRAEHAAILFLASLIPGVGERHIAARAAEENLIIEAQRQRREEEAAAASAAATEGVTGAGENEQAGGTDSISNAEALGRNGLPEQTPVGSSRDNPNTGAGPLSNEGAAQPLTDV